MLGRKQSIVVFTAFMIISLISRIETFSQQPEPTMTLYGHVFIQTVTHQNVTAPQGLHVYAKCNDSIVSNATIQEEGRYTLPITGLGEGTPVDLYVQDIEAATVQYHDWNVTWLNLTVIDLLPPKIEIMSPTPGITVFQLPIWVNSTVTDNLMVNGSATITKLNETALTSSYNSTNGLFACKAEQAAAGFYSIHVTATDLSGNTAEKTWNFTHVIPEPPTVNIMYPTTQNPHYTRSGGNIQVIYNYTESDPLNATITVYNATQSVGQLFISTLEKTGAERNDSVSISGAASDDKYSISVEIFNIYNLGEKAQQTEAVVVDDTPPTIQQVTQSPSPDNVQPTDTVKVNATIRDTMSGVLDTRLSWRIQNGEWNTTTMNKTSGDIYTATIPTVADYPDVYYKIEASDRLGNKAVEDNAGQYFIYHVVPEYSAALLTLLMLILTCAIPVWKKRTSQDI